MWENVMLVPMLDKTYIYFDLNPSLSISSSMSPFPWSRTFSNNFDERLKKSVKCFDLTKELSYYWLSSNLTNNYSGPPWPGIHLSCPIFFFFVIWVEEDPLIFIIGRFIYVPCCLRILSTGRIEFTCRRFRSWNQSRARFNSSEDWIIFFIASVGFDLTQLIHFEWLPYFFTISSSSSLIIGKFTHQAFICLFL